MLANPRGLIFTRFSRMLRAS